MVYKTQHLRLPIHLLLLSLLFVFISKTFAQPTSSVLAGGITINEVLIDPNGANNFDTDGNGTAATEDEFVEIFNVSGSAIDISGFQLWDLGIGNWFTFPGGTMLGPGNFAFVIVGVQAGGSLPTLPSGNLAFDAGRTGGVINNGGDNVVLYDPNNDEFIQILYNGDAADNPPTDYTGFSATATLVGSVEDWGNDSDGVSLVRDPDGDLNVVLHNSISANNASPGTGSFDVTVIKSVDIDIWPKLCPNPLDINSPYTLYVAVLGTQSFDIQDLDKNSVRLEGVAPLQIVGGFTDRSGPIVKQDVCDCAVPGGDGFADREFIFKIPDIVAALGPVNDGDEVVLTLTGNLKDGTPIVGQDCVIIKSGHGGGQLKKSLATSTIPVNYSLEQNYPNPFNPETEIRFQLPEAGHVVVRIFNTLGEEIRTLADAQYEAGYHSVRWDSKDNNGSAVSSGIYFYKMQAGKFSQVKKMSLLR